MICSPNYHQVMPRMKRLGELNRLEPSKTMEDVAITRERENLRAEIRELGKVSVESCSDLTLDRLATFY